MRTLFAVFMSAGLVACVSDHEALRNDRGQVVNCANEGWGWIGAPMAASNQADCVKKAEAAGFHRSEIADTATPAKAATATPQATPSTAPTAASTATPVTPVAYGAPAANASTHC